MLSFRGSACWLAIMACEADAGRDPLDPAAIDELSTQQGDAIGTGWSGDYIAAVELLSCDCPTIEIEQDGMKADYEICAAVDISGESGSTTIPIVQTDGFLLVTVLDTGQMTGPVDSDGTFHVAGRVDLESLLFDNQFLSRFDGRFHDDGGPPRLTGLHQQRVIASYLGQDIDCRASFDVEGER